MSLPAERRYQRVRSCSLVRLLDVLLQQLVVELDGVWLHQLL
jgi:hypothetical protein